MEKEGQNWNVQNGMEIFYESYNERTKTINQLIKLDLLSKTEYTLHRIYII